MRTTLVLLVSSAELLLVTREARAHDGAQPMLELDWSAPSECPDGAHVKARVEALVGADVHATRPLQARGQVTEAADASGYRLMLVVRRAAAERTMADADCARLAEAAALILALDIEEIAQADAPTEPLPPVPPDVPTRTSEAAAPRRPPRTAMTPAPPARERLSLSAGARVVLDHGSLPRTTGGLAVVAGAAHGRATVEQHAARIARQLAGGPPGGCRPADGDLATAGARACLRHLVETTAVRACAGAELGRMGTRGIGIAQPGSSAALWGAASLTFEARPFQLRPVSPVIGMTVGHPFTAPDALILGFGTVFEPPIVYLRTHLGLELRFF